MKYFLKKMNKLNKRNKKDKKVMYIWIWVKSIGEYLDGI